MAKVIFEPGTTLLPQSFLPYKKTVKVNKIKRSRPGIGRVASFEAEPCFFNAPGAFMLKAVAATILDLTRVDVLAFISLICV